MVSFRDAVSDWAKATPQRLDVVYARSIELLADEMSATRPNGGRVPIITGNLARSLLASTAGPIKVGGKDERFTGSDVGLVTATLGMGQDVWLGYQAAYSARVNFGFVGEDSLGRAYNQEGAHFVEGAIADWPIIVELASQDIEARVAARQRG